MRARAALTILAIVAFVVLGARTSAKAHTEVLRASPGPAELVDAPVDTVELTFLDPVGPDVTIAVLDLSGDPVHDLGPVEVSDDRRSATVSFTPLSDPGDYTVEYRFSAEDGDTQREAYRFTIATVDDRGGPQGDAPGDDSRTAALLGTAIAAGVLVVAVVAIRRRIGRRPEAGTLGENGGQRAAEAEE